MTENPARPAPGAMIARLADLPSNGAIALDFQSGEARFSLLVVMSGEDVRGFENVCPHAGYPLERPDGRVVMQGGRYLVCSAHGASFDGKTGACVGGPGSGRGLKAVALERDGDVIRMGRNS